MGLLSDPFDALQPIAGPELFIGLVSPIGAGLSLVCEIMTEKLSSFGYQTHVIQLSNLIREIDQFKNLETHPEDERIEAHMNAGTQLREEMERGDILALMSLLEIRCFRQEKHGDPKLPVPRQAYIFRSLKHPEEVAALRDIYGRLFFLVSAYSPKPKREDALKRIIARSHGDSDEEKYREQAVHLINKDEEEEGTKLGQDVSDAFPLADLFLHTASRIRVDHQVSRFVNSIFGHPFLTPTKDEMGMYVARSAAFRSADLSRQVGAAICDDDGETLAIGCNEVPKSFGGFYWPDEKHDDRDFVRGMDSSIEYKKSILQELVQKFKEKDFLSENISDKKLSEIRGQIDSGKFQELLSGRLSPLDKYGHYPHIPSIRQGRRLCRTRSSNFRPSIQTTLRAWIKSCKFSTAAMSSIAPAAAQLPSSIG